MSGDILPSGHALREYSDIGNESPRYSKFEHARIDELHMRLDEEIRRRARTEEALIRYEESFRAMREDAGSIANQYNNLLMGIQGNVSLMLAKLDPADELYSRLKNIEQYVASGALLTRDLFGMTGKDKCESSPDEGSTICGHTGTVMLVDDEQMVRDVCSEMLQSLGCKVITARNGAEAIELYKEYRHEIDLVILDMVMPQMSGEETFNRIRTINPGARVLISSGYSPEGETRKLLEGGSCGFIQKPFTIGMLSLKIIEISGNNTSLRS